MGKLGTFFGIAAAVLAIVAAALSFLIAQKRVMYAERAGKLADTIAQMAQKLDQNSNSGVAASVTFTPKSDEAAEDGSLSWSKYLESPSDFDGVLTSAITLAGDINEQRDSLADALGKTGTAMMMLDTDLDPANLKTLADKDEFTKAVDSVIDQAEAINVRDKAMIDALMKTSVQLKMPIKQDAFTRRTETKDKDGNVTKGNFPCVSSLSQLSGKVAGLVTRCNAYADSMLKAIHNINQFKWQANPAKIKSERDYAGVLAALENDFADINKQLALYARAKKEVAQQKEKIAQLMDAVEEARNELDDKKRDYKKLEQAFTDLKKATGAIDFGEGTVDINLTGEVLEVNDQWDFVIVSVGRINHIPENLKMLVARNDKFIAKLQVSKVLSKVCVAEVLPEARVGDIKVGDRVILPKQQE